MHITADLCSLERPVWIDERRVKGLCKPSVKVGLTDRAIRVRGTTAAVRAEVGSLVSCLLQHLKEVEDKAAEGKQVVARVEGSRTVTEAAKEGVVSQTLKLGLPDGLCAPTRVGQEREVVG